MLVVTIARSSKSRNARHNSSTRSPARLIAPTWSLARSTKVTSCRARARCAPIVPPIAPAPQTRNLMALGSAALGESVADQAERDTDDEQGQAGQRRHPPSEQQELASLGDHRAPLGRGRLGPES